MRRAIVMVVCSALLMLTGCSSRGPVGESIMGVSSAELTQTVEAIYGHRLNKLASDSAGSAEIRLASGEPTGTEPFAVLAALVDADPGRPRYQVGYVLPEPIGAHPETFHKSVYIWDSAAQSVRWETKTFSGSVGTNWINGDVVGLDAGGLKAIGAGRRQAPAF